MYCKKHIFINSSKASVTMVKLQLSAVGCSSRQHGWSLSASLGCLVFLGSLNKDIYSWKKIGQLFSMATGK